MRYTPTTSNFAVAFWKELWENNINDIEELRALAGTRGVVTIDIYRSQTDIGRSRRGRRDISELGISFLPPIACSPRPCVPSPASLDALMQKFSIQCHSIDVADQKSADSRDEKSHFVPKDVRVVAADQVEDTLLTIIKSFTSELDPQPLLVGFDIGYQFRVLSRDYPRLLTNCFSAWIDLQHITADISTIIYKERGHAGNLRGAVPGPRETFLALGYFKDSKTSRPLYNHHRSGNRAMRTMAVLLGLLALPQPSDPTVPPVIEITRQEKKVFHEKIELVPGLVCRKFWHGKPGPPGLFPYMARATAKRFSKKKATTKRFPLSPKFRAVAFYNQFFEYGPVAAGMAKEADKTRNYYLCLPNTEVLESFVAEVNGRAIAKSDGAFWSVAQAHSSPVTPITDPKDLLQTERFSEEARAKRLRREQKRLEKNPEDLLDNLSLVKW